MCASIGITIAHCNTLQHAATHYNTLQHTRKGCAHQLKLRHHSASHCNTLQHTTTHCNTLEVDVRMKLNRNYDESCRSEADRQVCSVLQCVAVCCSVLPCVAMCCSALQCAAVLLQYAAVRCSLLLHRRPEADRQVFISYEHAALQTHWYIVRIYWHRVNKVTTG